MSPASEIGFVPVPGAGVLHSYSKNIYDLHGTVVDTRPDPC